MSLPSPSSMDLSISDNQPRSLPALALLLRQWDLADSDNASFDTVERLSQFFDLRSSLVLSGLLGRSTRVKTAEEACTDNGRSATMQFAEQTVLQARQRLVGNVARNLQITPGQAASRFSRLVPVENTDLTGFSYEPFQRLYAVMQGEMSSTLYSLQGELRADISRVSPRLKQLALLDTAFEQALHSHVQKVLSGLPRLLQHRFTQLKADYQQSLPEGTGGDNPAIWTSTGGWLSQFAKDLQQVLLAELDVRMLPALGLLEALNEEVCAS